MRNFRSWWLWPLLGMLFCAAIMGFIMAGVARGRAADAATAALEGAGLDSAVSYVGLQGRGLDGIGGDGLNVVLEGPAANQEAAIAAVERQRQVDSVEYRVTEGDAEPAPEPETEPEPEPEVELAPMELAAAATAGAIVLDGTVSDQATKDAMVAAAEGEYGVANVTDNLVIDPDAVGEGGELVVTGEAESDAQKAEWIGQGTAVASAGGLELVDRVTVASIEQSLNDLFELEPIEFDVSRATIRPESTATLDTAAELINNNPDVGNLLVVGHTDSDGGEAANQALSDARAQAVVAYLVNNGGVDADRLESEGRGESELLVDPETSREDKQRNRRIAWELLS